MLPLLTGASRLVEAAREAGAKTVIYDTTGLVDPDQGGTALKLAKIDLLRPAVLFALQQDQELEALLRPLRRSKRLRVVEVRPAAARRHRDVTARQKHRATRFASYFEGAQSHTVAWVRLAVLPSLHFLPHRLVALEDVDGFTRGLAVVTDFDLKGREVTLKTPLASLDDVDTLRLGDLTLDPDSYRDQQLDPRKT
jgi:polynucleotide 5'-kinase involved in rRNA processing